MCFRKFSLRLVRPHSQVEQSVYSCAPLLVFNRINMSLILRYTIRQYMRRDIERADNPLDSSLELSMNLFDKIWFFFYFVKLILILIWIFVYFSYAMKNKISMEAHLNFTYHRIEWKIWISMNSNQLLAIMSVINIENNRAKLVSKRRLVWETADESEDKILNYILIN